jgi:hypothetical protein
MQLTSEQIDVLYDYSEEARTAIDAFVNEWIKDKPEVLYNHLGLERCENGDYYMEVSE